MSRYRLGAYCVLIGAAIVLVTGWARAQRAETVGGERHITVEARKYAFDPPTIRVNRGEEVVLNLITKDVTHGFYLEGHDLDVKIKPAGTLWLKHPSEGPEFFQVNEVRFKADRAGKCRYRCSTTGGYLHPFMLGELVVEPNPLYRTAIILSALVAIASLVLAVTREPHGGSHA